MSFALRWKSVPYEWRDINQSLHNDWVQSLLAKEGSAALEINLPVLTKGGEIWYNVGSPMEHLKVAQKIKEA